MLADLVQRLLAGASPALSTAGMPGVGKTALALALAYHPEVQAHFREGILWAGLGTQPDLAGIQAAWADALKVDITAIVDLQRRTEAIGTAIGRRRMLVVLDDAWALEPAQLLRPGGHVTCLLTTRDEDLAHGFAPAQCIHVPSLAEAPGFELLQRLAPEACAADPAAAARLAEATGGVPLTLELLGGYLAQPSHSLFPDLSKQAFDELADPRRRLALAQERLGGRRGQQQTLEEAIALSVGQLESARPEAAIAFYALGAFAPKPARFDRAAAEAVTGADGSILALLAARNLLEADVDGSLTLHQSLADYAAQHMPDAARVRHREYYLDLGDSPIESWLQTEAVYPQVVHAWNRQKEMHPQSPELMTFMDTFDTYQRHRGLWQHRLEWLNTSLIIVQAREDARENARLLNNIGGVYDALGDQRQALSYYEQALELRRQVGDRWGESITRFNVAMIFEHLGNLARAEEELTIVVALDAAIEHPDLASDRATLERIRAKRQQADGA